MKFDLSGRRARRVVCTLAAVAGAAFVDPGALAQTEAARRGGTQTIQSLEERVRIEPYTGPPIFLEEKRVIAPPTISRREVTTDKYEDGKIRVERQVAKFSDEHFESDGFYREFYPDGKPFIDGQFVRGRQDGQWTYWYDNGQTNRKVSFRNGQLHGAWEIYQRNGSLLATREYDNGLRHGQWVTYDQTGQQPLREEHYDKGTSEGVWKTWYPNGKLQREVTIKGGVRHGVATEWADDGKKVSEATWVEGKLDGAATVWRSDGKKVLRQYKNGALVSEKIE
jgi:antitoxin component YwqK of YwqJK toxin-antitoxin module